MILHYFLNFLLFISLIFIFLTTHPIYTVLFLILLFLEASVTLFLFNIEFLSLMLIIIYVGAIAVLFLFVVMLLNLKFVKERLREKAFIVTTSLLILSIITYKIIKSFVVDNNILINNFINSESYTNLYYDTLNNVELMGQLLFNEYILSLLLVGLILLVPLIGAVILTFNYSKTKQSSVTLHQLSRGNKTVSIFK